MKYDQKNGSILSRTWRIFQKILINPNLKIKPELKERFNFAKEGLIEANESLRLDDNPFSDYDLTRKILGNIEESSLSEYKEEYSLLSRILYSLSITDSFEAEEIVSNLERLYQQYEPKADVQVAPEVTYTEEVFQDSTDWYVSSGSTFSLQEKIYGPFKNELSAILFPYWLTLLERDWKKQLLKKMKPSNP